MKVFVDRTSGESDETSVSHSDDPTPSQVQLTKSFNPSTCLLFGSRSLKPSLIILPAPDVLLPLGLDMLCRDVDCLVDPFRDSFSFSTPDPRTFGAALGCPAVLPLL